MMADDAYAERLQHHGSCTSTLRINTPGSPVGLHRNKKA